MNYEPTSMSGYFSDKDRIAELEKQVLLLTSTASKWKVKYELSKPREIKVKSNRKSKAERLICVFISGDKSLSLKEIALKCFLAHSTVRKMACLIRKQQKESKNVSIIS